MTLGPIQEFPPQLINQLALEDELEKAARYVERKGDALDRVAFAILQAGALETYRSGSDEAREALWSIVDRLP